MNKKSKNKKSISKSKKPSKVVVNTNTKGANITKVNVISNDKSSYLDLPVSKIKSDLFGIVVFSLVAFGIISLLKYYNVDIELILSYFASIR